MSTLVLDYQLYIDDVVTVALSDEHSGFARWLNEDMLATPQVVSQLLDNWRHKRLPVRLESRQFILQSDAYEVWLSEPEFDSELDEALSLDDHACGAGIDDLILVLEDWLALVAKHAPQ